MARPWRIQYTNAIYHVMSRGVAQGEVFYADEDYHKFLEYLEKASEKFQLEIFAFVLMVKELEAYKWNSYHDYAKTKKIHHWVSCEEILKGFDKDEKKRGLNIGS